MKHALFVTGFFVGALGVSLLLDSPHVFNGLIGLVVLVLAATLVVGGCLVHAVEEIRRAVERLDRRDEG